MFGFCRSTDTPDHHLQQIPRQTTEYIEPDIPQERLGLKISITSKYFVLEGDTTIQAVCSANAHFT